MSAMSQYDTMVRSMGVTPLSEMYQKLGLLSVGAELAKEFDKSKGHEVRVDFVEMVNKFKEFRGMIGLDMMLLQAVHMEGVTSHYACAYQIATRLQETVEKAIKEIDEVTNGQGEGQGA